MFDEYCIHFLFRVSGTRRLEPMRTVRRHVRGNPSGRFPVSVRGTFTWLFGTIDKARGFETRFFDVWNVTKSRFDILEPHSAHSIGQLLELGQISHCNFIRINVDHPSQRRMTLGAKL
jgi:hypothetical protein